MLLAIFTVTRDSGGFDGEGYSESYFALTNTLLVNDPEMLGMP
jgi:hypothetical protein